MAECKQIRIRGKARKLCWAIRRIPAHDQLVIISNTAISAHRGPHKTPGKGKAYNLILARPKKAKGRQSPGGGVGGLRGLRGAFKKGKGGRKVLRKGCRFARGGRLVCRKVR